MAQITVTTLDDVVDNRDGLVSLREAIAAANNDTATEEGDTGSGNDEIVFAGRLFGTLRLTQGELEITEALTIDGSNRIVITGDANGDDVTVSGTDITDVAASRAPLLDGLDNDGQNGVDDPAESLLDDNSRIFDIDYGPTGVSLIGLTLTGGYSGSSGGAIDSGRNLNIQDSTFRGNGSKGNGGAIWLGAEDLERFVSIRDSTVSDNWAGGGGGGIVASHASVFVTRSEVSGNTSEGSGGGITGTDVFVTESTVVGNTSQGGGGGLHGHDSFRFANIVRVYNSTISDNTAAGSGGGILAGEVTLHSSTLHGNSTTDADALGGGIYGDDVTLVNSTVSGNSTAGPKGSGGGIYGNAVLLANSILLGNVYGGDGIGRDEFGFGSVFARQGLNIVGEGNDDNSNDGIINAAATDVFSAFIEVFLDTDGDGVRETPTGILAGYLTDNGGPVETVALVGGTSNPAFDTGDDSVVPTSLKTDATGKPRILGAAVDLGAFESDYSRVIIGTPGPDALDGYAGQDTIAGRADDDFLQGLGAIDRLKGETGEDLLLGGDGDDVIFGDGQSDQAFGGEGDDEIFGGIGDDTLLGEAGEDRIKGQAGDDTVRGGAADDILFGDTGEDDIRGNAGDDRAFGGSQDDEIQGDDGDDRLSGNTGDDTLEGGDGADTLLGLDGDDMLDGGAGNDRVFGFEGDDVLAGGTGNDRLVGGEGLDRYIFENGTGEDVVADFVQGEDLIDLTATSVTGLGDLTISGNSKKTVIFEASLGQVSIFGVGEADIEASDFLFAGP